MVVRPPRRRDGAAWSEIRLANEAWLSPWEPSSSYGWGERHARAAWPGVLGALRKAARAGTVLPFMIDYGGRLVGQINVANVVHGVQRSGTVGYWVDSRVAGRGITPTALALVIDHCFAAAGLHRVTVEIRPENAPSLRVVAKLGLRQEGYFQRYLDIDGGWRDHLSFAVTVEEVASGSLLSRLAQVPQVPPVVPPAVRLVVPPGSQRPQHLRSDGS